MSTLQLSSKNVCTRKPHQCYSCYRVMPAGVKMNKYAGLWEGDFCSMYCCMACKTLMNRSDDRDGFQEGWAREFLSKGQTPEDYLKLLRINIMLKKEVWVGKPLEPKMSDSVEAIYSTITVGYEIESPLAYLQMRPGVTEEMLFEPSFQDFN